MLSFAVGCVLVVVSGQVCFAGDEPWEIKAAGDVFFSDYETKVGTDRVKADGFIPGATVTLKKGAFSGELSLRSGTIEATEPLRFDIERLDVDLKLSWWPKMEELERKGIHWFVNLGYHFYKTEWKEVFVLGHPEPQKTVHGPYVGLGAFWMLKPMGRLRTTLKAEANGLVAFANADDFLASYDPDPLKVAGGVLTRAGAVFDFLLIQNEKVTWTAFADGGWQYETIFFSQDIGRDTYFGPYIRVGTRFMF
jgi:hypothetical protein